MPTHLHVVGAQARDRRPHLDLVEGQAVFASCEKGLRGPYTGVDTVLAAVLPDTYRRRPELVDYHRLEILEGMPELSDIIGPAPRTLANEATFGERTRWFEASMVRVLSQGVITLLREYARRLRAENLAPPTLVFDAVHRADPTTQEFIELFVRRIDADLWPLILGSNGDISPALAAQLDHRASRIEAAPLPHTTTTPPDTARLAADYIESDGTSEDPTAYAAYLTLDSSERAVLHDQRADALEPGASWGVKSTAASAATARRAGRDQPGWSAGERQNVRFRGLRGPVSGPVSGPAPEPSDTGGICRYVLDMAVVSSWWGTAGPALRRSEARAAGCAGRRSRRNGAPGGRLVPADELNPSSGSARAGTARSPTRNHERANSRNWRWSTPI